MNKQQRTGTNRGIEWTDYTWNPISGCLHGCAWKMPDGTTANCYAEDIANRFTSVYPNGFEHHYWHPERLDEPLSLREPSKIFVGSMADVFGHWVPDEQIQAVLDICNQARHHTFQFLTKNAPRLTRFKFPANCWVGVSVPPTHYMGKELTRLQQVAMLDKTLDVLREVNAQTAWMSIEPLSWDVAEQFRYEQLPFDWVVIGAASNGPRIYQPEPKWVERLLHILDCDDIPVFFKGNLQWEPHREEFPITDLFKLTDLLF